MILLYLMYSFLQPFYGLHNYLHHKLNTHIQDLLENKHPYGLKKSNSMDSLDSYSSFLSFTNPSKNYQMSGYDERYPIDSFYYYSFYNATNLANATNNYFMPIEDYKNLVKIALFLLRNKFISKLENPNLSTVTKINLINKYYKKPTISAPNIRNGGLMDDFEI